MVKKIDGRKLDSATQAHLRRSVVLAVRGGMTQVEAAGTFGLSLRAVSKYMALDRSGGLRALKLGVRGRRTGSGRLTVSEAAKVRALIVGKMPDQLKLPFYLWTRAAVAQLIEREFGTTMSLTSVGRYLKSWGMSPQKPTKRAYERNDVAIARWLRLESPAIARDAKREGATIYWGDEMGLRSDHIAGTRYSPMGHTPIVRTTGQRFGCNMISAISNRGQRAFMVFQGSFGAPLFVNFMQRLIRQAKGKIYLIVDGHPVHRSRIAKDFVSANEDTLRLIRLPGYRTIRKKHRTHSSGTGGGTSYHYTEERRALFLPQEIKELPMDDMLIFYEGCRPIRCKKNWFFKDKLFSERANRPPVQVASIAQRLQAQTQAKQRPA